MNGEKQEYNIYCYINMHKYAIVTADLENVFSRYNLCKVRGFLKLHGSMSETTFMKQTNGNNWRSQDKLVICHLMRYSSIYLVFYFIL